MLDEACELLRVLKAPLAHVQAIYLFADEIFGVSFGREPRLDDEGAEHNVVDIESWRFGGVFFSVFEIAFCAVNGYAICNGGTNCH